MAQIPTALLYFGFLLYAACADDDLGQKGPAKWGDSDYWLLLNSIEASAGHMSPKFTPGGGEYELVVEDAHVDHVTFTLGLDFPKYDLMYPPRITVDGVEKEYKPIDAIQVDVPLNETIGVEDKTLMIALEDPKGQLDKFAVKRLFGQHSARMVYTIHIRQPPLFGKVVRASAIVVKNLTGGLIPSEPRFDGHSENVDYSYLLSSEDTSITFQLVCPKEATGLIYNGIPATPDQVQTLHIEDPVTTALAQCVYSDARWTNGRSLQRTYVLTFKLDADISKTSVDLRMMPRDGSCETETINGQDGFRCRSAHAKSTMVALYDSPRAQVELKRTNGSAHVVIMQHGLPVKVRVPKGPAPYELTVSAGRFKRSFPVIMARPEICGDFKCPPGKVPKPNNTQVVALCSAAACTPADAPRCCDRAVGWDVTLLEANGDKKKIAEAIETVMGTQPAIAEHLVDEVPSPVAEGVGNAEAAELEASLTKLGGIVRKKPTKFVSFNLTLEKTGPRKNQVEEALERAAHLSQIFALKVVETPPVQFKSGLTNDEARHIQGQLEDLGAQVTIHGELRKYELIITNIPSGDLDKLPPEQRNKLVDEVAGIMNISTEEVLERLKKLPLKVAEGPEEMVKKKAKLLRDLGIGCVIKEAVGAHCNKFKCPKGKILRREPETIACASSPCRKTDEKVCCGEKRLCSHFFCPSHWGHRIMPNGASCAEPDCRDVCCSRLSFCDTYQCPDGYIRSPSAHVTSCWQETCDQFGLKLCCNRKQVCKDFKVPLGFILKPNAANLTADPLTVKACAEPQDRCNSLKCPAGTTLKPKAFDIFCAGTECTAKDEQVCCEKAGTCLGYDCPPNSITRPNAWLIPCALKECSMNDIARCCEPRARCSSLTCPHNQILVKNADSLYCRQHNCTSGDANACCEDKATCADMRCPQHYGPKPDLDFLRCAGAKCTRVDRDVCCDSKRECRKLPVPDGYVLKDNCWFKWVNEWEEDTCFEALATCESFMCPLGFLLKPKPEKIRCGEAVCSDADAGVCCERRHTPTKRLHITVEDKDGHGKCTNIEDGFWCFTLRDKIHLWIMYRVGDELKKKTPIAAIDVPNDDEGVKHVRIMVRDDMLDTSTLSIWVGRAGLQEHQVLTKLAAARAKARNESAGVPLKARDGNDTSKDQASSAVASQRRLRSGAAEPEELLV